MDFFEKAHSVKKASKDNKKTDLLKKQLKEMLHGYKNNDTDVIKQSSERKQEFDEILSTSSLMEYEAISLKSESKKLAAADQVSNVSDNSGAVEDITDLSVSESSDTLQDHSHSSFEKHDSTQLMIEKDCTEIRSDISSNFSSPGVSSSDEFDADGQLASKIHNRLNVHTPTADVEINCKSPISNESIGVSHPYENTTLPNKSINELFKQYKHSTVKNIPDGLPTGIIHEDALNSFSLPVDQDTLDYETIAETEISNNVDDVEDTDQSMLNNVSNVTLDVSDAGEADDRQQPQMMDYENEEDLNPGFTNQVDIYYCRKSCIFVLRHPAEIYLHGKVRITPMAGSVKVFGSTIDRPCDIFAPNNNFAQHIETQIFNGSNYGLFGKLTAVGLSVPETEDIVTTLGENDAVIMLQSLASKKIDFVEQSFLNLDLFSKQNKHISNYFKKASDLLGVSLYLTRPWKYFEENPIWDDIIKFGMNAHSRGVLCGGKGAGKSTFLRYYVNRLVGRGPVLVVDLDPGQPELTVAGCVSAAVVARPLLGPNYTHLTQPDRTLNIGMINVMDNLSRYTSAVSELLAHCHSQPQYRAMPWVVNTMGMCNSVGLKLMALIILKLRPTFVVQFDSKKRFECHLSADRVRRLYRDTLYRNYMFRGIAYPEHMHYELFVSCQNRDAPLSYKSSLAPRDERYLNFLGYFGELMDITKHSEFLSIVPYEIPLRNFNIGSNVKIAEDDINKVINGKIIALCQQHTVDKPTRMFRLEDKPLLCLGHGLVRGVDAGRGTVFVATPAPRELLRRVDTLVYCDWAPELLGQARRLPRGAPVPYRTDTLPDHRQLMFTPKRRFNPIQLLKMARAD